MTFSMRRAVVCLLWIVLGACFARAQQPEAAKPAEVRHGWRARFESIAVPTRSVETTIPTLSLALGESDAPQFGLTSGWWWIRSAARLEIPRSGRYRFGLEVGTGKAAIALRLEDGTWLRDEYFEGERAGALRWTNWIELPASAVELHVDITREPGEARVIRAWWEMAEHDGRGFRAEPVPLRATTPIALPASPGGAPQPEFQGEVEATDLALLANKGCQHCHAGSLPGLGRMASRAPSLEHIAERVDVAWLESWILDPVKSVAHADMPSLFGESAAERESVRDIVDFLAAQTLPAQPESAAATADVERGMHLYHELGCIACHGAREAPAVVLGEAFLEQELPKIEPRRALPDLTAKWRRAGLEAFLLDPVKFHPGGRMPSFLLDASEARALVAYLMPREPARVAHAPDATRAARGRAAFDARGCGACHTVEDASRSMLTAKSMRELDGSKPCRAARYDLREGEASQLARAWKIAGLADAADAPQSHASFAFERNNCGACHARAGTGGVPGELRAYFRSEYEETDLGDEGRIPPDLGDAGTKLHAAWIQRVLDTGVRARPYLRARMPVFAHDAVAGLGAAIARSAGVEPNSDAEPPACSDELARIGRDLVGREQLSCIACHLYKDFPPNGTPGPALERFGERLRYEWFRAFVPDPARAKPGTRMPTFGNAGTSSLTRVLGGDLHKQVDALWCYSALGDAAPVPPGVEKQRSLELVVGERPLVLRTFLAQAGPRGIAIGYPNGLSFAYDAATCRLVDAWKGAFLDASGPWAERGGNNASGQGPKVWSAPSGPALLLGALPDAWPETSAWKWRGYSLDARGAPIFEAVQGAVTLRERCDGELLPRAVVHRRFELEGLAPRSNVSFRAGGDGVVVVAGVDAAHRTVRRGEETWHELVAGTDGALRFEWSVKP